MSPVLHISENDLKSLLNWDSVFDAVEVAFEGLSKGFATQGVFSRTSTGPAPNFLALLPGCINHHQYGGISCKFFTVKSTGEHTYVAFMDLVSGALKAIIHGNTFSAWRTAAASLVAAKHLHGLNSGKPNKILAVCGAGNMGQLHALAFQHFYNFDEVRIWNRTGQRAKDLVAKLNTGLEKPVFNVADSCENCVKNADVIVAATSASETIIKYCWVKPGAHITAIGVNPRTFELDDETYRNASVYVDSLEYAKIQLRAIEDLGVKFQGQVGDVIAKKVVLPDSNTVTVFQSLGMGVEDCAVARMIYDSYVTQYTRN